MNALTLLSFCSRVWLTEAISSGQPKLGPISLAMYQQLYLINTYANEAYFRTLLPILNSILSSFVIFCLYTTIRFSGTVDLPTAIFLIMFSWTGILELVATIDVLAKLYDLSSTFEKDWRIVAQHLPTAVSRKCYKRKLKCCRPVCSPCSHLYFVKKSTKSVYIKIIFDITIHLLLTI